MTKQPFRPPVVCSPDENRVTFGGGDPYLFVWA